MVELPQPASRIPRRVVFVDGLRLVAAFQMVQGHTLDALLAEPLRQGAAFHVWTFVRGLTSVAFLLTAGLAFALATASDVGLRGGRKRRLRRALKLLVIGYLMHAPLGALFGETLEGAFRAALVVDVLQCIGVALIVLEALCALARTRAVRGAWGGLLAGLCFGLAPSSEHWVPDQAGRAFMNYLSARGGSLFPLLPWAGFVFAGLCLGQLVVDRERAPRQHPWPRLAGFGLGALAWSAGLFVLLPSFPARVSPAYALLKLGLVALVAAGLSAALEGRKLPLLLRRLSSETLFLYVSHVLVLYAGHVGLVHWLGRRWGLAASLGWTLLLLVGASAGALGYRRVQQALRARGGGGTPRPQPS